MNLKINQLHAYSDDFLGTMDGVETAGKIASGKISAAEVVTAAIDRAKKVNPTLNAIVTEMYHQALEKSKTPQPGIFSGVPSFIKDTDNVAGAPTRYSSRAVPLKIKKKSCKFVRQFHSLGLICLGKSNLPEFGLTATTESVATGAACNPWNLDYSTGGSSGGSAALVAAGVVPLAHGNDGGGSIRIPAACCGLVGLKPTRGRLIKVDGSELLPVGILHQGIVSRTVRDTAAFYEGAEKYYRNPKLPEIGRVLHPGKKRLRIGLFTETPFGTQSHAETTEMVLDAGKLCERLGHDVTEIRCPFHETVIADFWWYWGMMAFMIRFVGFYIVGSGFERSKMEEWGVGLGRLFQKKLCKAPSIIMRLKGFEKIYNDIFRDYDILLSPTLSHPAPKLGYLGPDVPFDTALERVGNYCAFTPFQNISGAPAISLPMGFSKNRVPMGVQFAATTGMERLLIELAYEIEEAKPWPLLTD
ncbi:MAG: amidase [Pseudomonadota bacterium]